MLIGKEWIYIALAVLVGITMSLFSPESWKDVIHLELKGDECSDRLVLKEGMFKTACGDVEISLKGSEFHLRVPEKVKIEIDGSEYLPQSFDKEIWNYSVKPLRRAKSMGFVLGFSITLYVLAAKFSYVITSVLVIFFVSILGVLDPKSALSSFSSPVIFVFLAGSAFELAMSVKGLDRSIGKRMVAIAKGKFNFLLMVIVSSSLLSAIMSNTAATYVMVPIVITSVVGNLEPVLLSLVASTALGGSLTLIGTPPNLIVSKFIKDITGTDVDFVDWLRYGFPIWITGIPVVVLLTLIFSKKNEFRVKDFEGDVVPLTKDQVKTLILIASVITLWAIRLNSGVVGLLAIGLFVLFGVLKPEDVKKLRWDLVILFSGGLTLGKALVETGYAQWIIGKLPIPHNDWELFLMMCAVLMIGTVFSSHTSASAVIGPTMIPLGMAMSRFFNVVPEHFGLMLAIMTTLSINTAMALPISTPPSAVVFSTGRITVKNLIVYGLIFGFTVNAILVFVLKGLWI